MLTHLPARALFRSVLPATCLALVAACGSGGTDSTSAAPMEEQACNPATEFCGSVPLSANACTDTKYFPLSVQSAQHPLTVHYSQQTDMQKAAQMIEHLDHAWSVQIDGLGFSAPLGDDGKCGTDDRYDVFIWRGVDGAFVDAVDSNPLTEYDDYTTYMAIDTSGIYGGAYLETTLAHEFNHSAQASDDWWEDAVFFEMSATFVEALTYPDEADYYYTLTDFQQHPEWSLFYNDNYRTWYMYGAAMYLHFLSERYFPSDPAFIARVWHGLRSDPTVARPDFLDALRSTLLADVGIDLDNTVTEFMQWRWFVAGLDDGKHFAHGSEWPVAVTYRSIDAAAADSETMLSAMAYGTNYLRIENAAMEERTFTIDLQVNGAAVNWVLSTIDGDSIAGSLAIAAQSNAVLVATALPAAVDSYAALDFTEQTATLSLHAQ